MPTVAAVVARALRLVRMLDPNESPEAVDMQTGIEALNAMMVRWEADGVSVGWTPVSGPGDTLPAPDECEEPIVFNLAVRLAVEYSVPLPAKVEEMAVFGLGKVQADVASSDGFRMALDLPRPDAYAWGSLNEFRRG